MRHLLLLALVAGLSGCRAGPRPEGASRPSYQLHDLTQTFWRYWARAEHLPAAEQVRLLEAQVIGAHPEVYTAAVIGLDADKPFGDELRRRWPKFLAFARPQLPLARELSASIGRDLPRYDARFREFFPDFSYDGEVYFLVSLGGFDGGLRVVKGQMALLFGLDVIAAVYGADADPEPFFDHELFHLYHRQFPDPEFEGTFGWALWSEGLAQFVAQRLNPKVSEAVLLGLPRSSPGRVRADLAALTREVRGLLDSRSAGDYQRFFQGSDEAQRPPTRAGYTIGYLVVKELAGERSLPELARLRGPVLRKELDAALDRLATAGPASAQPQ